MLASIAQQFDKPKKIRVVETHPPKDKVLVNNEIIVSKIVGENPSEKIMSGASHSISLLSVIS